MSDTNAAIVIENKQISEDGTESFNEKYDCKYRVSQNKAYVLYKNEGVTTKIKIENNTVTVTRMGEFSSEMVYKEGEKNSFLYKMPYGSMEMELKTQYVKTKISETGAEIYLEYELLFSGTQNKNSMKISVKK